MKFYYLLLISILFITSCASSRRMMRHSPFRSKEPTSKQVVFSEERVNTWPLYYRNLNDISILWPVIDIDKHGWSLRPIYNKEYNDQSILFPLSSWNIPEKQGWVFPFYWDKGMHGMLPLYHHNPDPQKLSYYGPYWKKDQSMGVFPFFCQEEPKGAILYPLGHWNRENQRGYTLTSYWHPSYYGCFPLFHIHRNNGLNVIGPFWRMGENQGLFPLFSYGPSLFQVANYMYHGKKKWGFYPFIIRLPNLFTFFPFYHNEEAQEYHHQNILSGILFSQKRSLNNPKNDFLNSLILGIYSHEKKEEKETHLLFPFWYYKKKQDQINNSVLFSFAFQQTEDKKNITRNLLPGSLAYYYKNKETQFRNLNLLPFGLLCSFNQYDPTTYNNYYLCGLIKQSQEGNEQCSSLRFFPFFRHKKTPNRKELTILGLINSQTKNSDSEIQKQEEAKGVAFWPFYSQIQNLYPKDDLRYHFSLTGRSIQDKYQSKACWCFPLFNYTKNQKGDTFHWLLLGGMNKNDTSYAHWLFPFYFYSKNPKKNHYFHINSPLFRLKRQDNFYSWNSLLGLIGSSKDTRITNCEEQQSYLFHETTKETDPKTKTYRESKNTCIPLVFSFQKHYLDDVCSFAEANASYQAAALLNLFSYKKRHYSPQAVPASQDDSFQEITEEKQIEIKNPHDKQELLATLIKFSQANSFTTEKVRYRFWPIYRREKSGYGLKKSSVFFGLYTSEANGNTGYTQIAKYLYRSQKDANGTRRDIFPFISIDLGKQSGFSFLGHFLNFRKNKNGHYGHILFIPYGKK